MKVYPHDRLGALLTGRLDDATPETKHLTFMQMGRELVHEALAEQFDGGWTTSPLFALLLREKLTLYSPESSVDEHLRFHAALERDITRLVQHHHAWRHAHHGNVVWEFTGPTGSGKSSCMLHLLEHLNHVQPNRLAQHLTSDVANLPHLLPTIPNGSGLVIDEQASLIGEGSVTQEKILRNIEDQIRASGIDLYWASPTKDDKNDRHATSQGEFEAYLLNPQKHATPFLVWLQGVALGYCDIPWASPSMWRAYEPLKAANVERALRAKFQGPARSTRRSTDFSRTPASNARASASASRRRTGAAGSSATRTPSTRARSPRWQMRSWLCSRRSPAASRTSSNSTAGPPPPP